MSKRRSSVLGKKGKGGHQPEAVPQTKRTGKVKPVVSKTRHGKPIEPDVSDGCAGFLVGIIIALYFLIT